MIPIIEEPELRRVVTPAVAVGAIREAFHADGESRTKTVKLQDQNSRVTRASVPILFTYTSDIAGEEKANPLATLLSFAMMLRYSFDMHEDADLLAVACSTSGCCRTRRCTWANSIRARPVGSSGWW